MCRMTLKCFGLLYFQICCGLNFQLLRQSVKIVAVVAVLTVSTVDGDAQLLEKPREGKSEPLLDPLDSPLSAPSNLLQHHFDPLHDPLGDHLGVDPLDPLHPHDHLHPGHLPGAPAYKPRYNSPLFHSGKYHAPAGKGGYHHHHLDTSSVHRNPYETHYADDVIRTQDADLAVRLFLSPLKGF